MPRALSIEHTKKLFSTTFHESLSTRTSHRHIQGDSLSLCMCETNPTLNNFNEMNEYAHRLHEPCSSECSHCHNDIEQNKYYGPETINDFMLNMNNRNVSKPNSTWQSHSHRVKNKKKKQ